MLWVLSITDLLFAISGKYFAVIVQFVISNYNIILSVFPYVIHYISFWNPVEFDYDGILVIKLSYPLTLQYKITLLIGLAIALERCQVSLLFIVSQYLTLQGYSV